MAKYNIGDIFCGDYPVTQYFGNNFKLPNGNWAYRVGHMGIDFGTPDGTQIVACFDGVVFYAKDTGDGYGKKICIWDKQQKLAALYGHLKDYSVKEGDEVWFGRLLGHSDNTGFSTGAHLHFGLIPTDANGYRTNPPGSIDGAVDPAGCFTKVVNLSAPLAKPKAPDKLPEPVKNPVPKDPEPEKPVAPDHANEEVKEVEQPEVLPLPTIVIPVTPERDNEVKPQKEADMPKKEEVSLVEKMNSKTWWRIVRRGLVVLLSMAITYVTYKQTNSEWAAIVLPFLLMLDKTAHERSWYSI